jgi:hypothetical protein
MDWKFAVDAAGRDIESGGEGEHCEPVGYSGRGNKEIRGFPCDYTGQINARRRWTS